MSGVELDTLSSPEEACAVVFARIRSRSGEIAQVISASMPSVTDLATDDSVNEYQRSRISAITAMIRYGLEVAQQEQVWGSIPQPLVDHVRCTARVGIRAGMLVRHYLAGYRQFTIVIREEVEKLGHPDPTAIYEYMQRTYQSLLEHIIVSIEREHEHECRRISRLPSWRRVGVARRLLAEDVDPGDLQALSYNVLSLWHIGMIICGAESAEILQTLQDTREHDLLPVTGDDGTVWAWLGGRVQPSSRKFKRLLLCKGKLDVSVAIGEPRYGLNGWRQTHQEARLALPIARREPGLVWCADILPVAAAAQSEAIVRMYERTYVLPLNRLHKDGRPAREALRAYFKHHRNYSSAGHAANLSRKTIENHVHDVRRLLGDDLNLTALEIALRLEELGYMSKDSSQR